MNQVRRVGVRARWAIIGVALALGAPACSAMKSAGEPQSPPTAAAYGAQPGYPQGNAASTTDAPGPAPAPEAPKPAEKKVEDEADPAAALARAEAEIDRAFAPGKRAPAEAGGAPRKEEPLADSCSIACRALASMRRSADRVCELAPSASPDAPRCDDAKERLGRAERRVRERCPACAATP